MSESRREPHDSDRAPESTRTEPGAARRRYRRPRLTAYGDLRTLTLGGSPGMGDSGSTMMIRKPL